jgi:hypothetical protein
MRLFRAIFLLLLPPALIGSATGAGASPTPPVPPAAVAPKAPKTEQKSEWVFSLLPKSMQKNPRLDITVITEMTPAGKAMPPVTPQNSAYFEPFSTGPKHLGESAGNHVSLKQEQIEPMLLRALATNGYLPAHLPEHPPSLLVIYTWGSHSLLTEPDEENPMLSGQQVARNLLDRAAMVGGEKFARQMLELFTQADAMAMTTPTHLAPGAEPVFTPAMAEFMNPVAQFKRSDPRNEFLVDQAASNIYYVVASAYDYKSAASNKRTLFWRTRMTVGADGVSQVQTLPTLVQTAAPYFGREMTEPEILSRRPVREGTVEVGTPTVVDPDAKLPRPAAPRRK